MLLECQYPCYKKQRKPCIQTKKPPNTINLICFDMDGVLVDAHSSWKHIHDHFNTSNEHSVDLYLQGEISDIEFIKRDICLWKKNNSFVHQSIIENILYSLPLMKGSKELIDYLKKNKVQTAIISAGLHPLAAHVAKQLGIDLVFANGYKVDTNGYITGEGFLNVELIHKEKAIIDLATTLSIPLNTCIAVGNSCFDIPMFEICGLGIAFNPSDACVINAADYVINSKNLKELIPILASLIEKKNLD